MYLQGQIKSAMESFHGHKFVVDNIKERLHIIPSVIGHKVNRKVQKSYYDIIKEGISFIIILSWLLN